MSQGENGFDEEALQRLTSTIVQKIGEGAQKTESFFSSACIYRVPEELRMLKESAYTPRLIAIGPLHREDKHLQTPFQHVKMSYTNNLLSRLTAGMEDLELAKKTKFTVVQKCLAELKISIDDEKKWYATEATLDEEMMLVDGCFILELFYRYRTKTGPNTDPIIGNTFTLPDVKNDLVLLENQIPFIVLEKLFQLTVGRIPDRPKKDWSLTDYVRFFYANNMMPERNSNNSGSAKSRWCSPSDCVLRVFGCTTAAAAKEEEGVQSGENTANNSGSAKSRWCSPSDCVLRVFGCTTAAAANEEEGVQSGENTAKNCGSAKSRWCSPSDCVLRVFGCTTAAAAKEEGVQSGENTANNSGSAKSRWCSPSDRVLRVFGCTTAAAAKEEEGVQSGENTAKHYHHILHYLHDRCLPPLDKANQKNFDYREMPSASELVYAGVEFAPDTGNDLFKFKFSEPKGLFRWCHRARFEIPPFTIYDETESYLRNLIALEQCCPGVSLHVSSYVFVMDLLVDNGKDIQVLENAGILKNYLGGTAEDAADLFNKLSKEIVEGGYFAETCIRATKYSKGFWPKNMAHVRRTYFKSPWTFIAFCVGFIVFIMTVLQFVHDFFKKSG